jgi:23S rRNA pseudouridine1911/1915/1917 synthase
MPRQKSGTIDAPIARHPVHRQRMSIARRAGRSAKTDYRVLQSNGEVSLVECTIHSGRTHQIRIHLHHVGHPVLGDKLYGGKRAGDFPRQMLHAWKLSFVHPRTEKPMNFTAPIPDDFRNAIPTVQAGVFSD